MTVVTLLSDYGLADEFVGVCHGVICADRPRGASHHLTTFADVPPGELLSYGYAYGALSLAINRESAFEALGLEIDGRVQIARAE